MWNGAPTVHVWRRRQIGEWQAEGFVEPETVAGTPENLRALWRLLEGWDYGNPEPSDVSDWLTEVLQQAAYRLRKMRAWED